jgi:hypothetical protein
MLTTIDWPFANVTAAGAVPQVTPPAPLHVKL